MKTLDVVLLYPSSLSVPICSDMQIGTDLLRRQKKGDKANVKLCSPELGTRGTGLGG